MMNYILDANNNPVAVPNTSKGWEIARKFREHPSDPMRVAATTIGTGWVSTVFLGLDHNHNAVGAPILWETMVFDSEGFDGICERYTSHADAVKGHETIVARVKKALDEN